MTTPIERTATTTYPADVPATEARPGETPGTVRMISSERVEGTKVYGPDDRHIGAIHHLMIEKVSGHVAYAVMSFGGFLGMGKDYYPIPWQSLRYDTRLDGYVTDVTKEQVEGSPDYDRDRFDWADDDWHRRTHEHYGRKPTYIGYM